MHTAIAEPFKHLKPTHAAVATWLYETDWDLAMTLTCKENTTEDQALKTIRHFWNVIDRELYGNQARYGKRSKRVCFVETGYDNTNFHFHILALTPADKNMDVERYGEFLAAHWRELPHHAGHVNDIAPIRSGVGCMIYSSKSTKYNSDGLELFSTNV